MFERNPRLARIIDRIRKLTALAEGGGSESEAEQAMRRVHALLARHNLRLEDVLADGPRREPKDRVRERVDAADHPWERPVWMATAALYFCEYFFEPPVRGAGQRRGNARVVHNLVGRPHNALVARLMIEYFLKTVRRLARREALCVPPSERRSFAHSFRVACAARLAERIWERKQRTRLSPTHRNGNSGPFLPALRPLYDLEEEANRQFLDDLGIRLKRWNRARVRITDVLGEHAGRRAAEDIGLEPQLGAGPVAGGGRPLPGGGGQMQLPLRG